MKNENLQTPETETVPGFAGCSVADVIAWAKENRPELLQDPVKKEYDCFLSVIIRTQGNRPESLLETFLMLEGQTDQDFEILLVVHKAKPEGKKNVEETLSWLSDGFREKLRVWYLDEGTRSTPLNFGAVNARGSYYVALDDDDLITDHWVETFHAGAETAPGKLIRSWGVTQPWKSIPIGENRQLLRASGDHKCYFCTSFTILQMLKEDICPIATVAIPTEIVQQNGLRYNEELNVCEDWEFLTRAILVYGMWDAGSITFIYRLWNKSNGDSHAQHAWEEWLNTIEKIQSEFRDFPVTAPYDDLKTAINANLFNPIKEDDSADVSTVSVPAVHRPGFFEKLGASIKRHGILIFPFAMIFKICKFIVHHAKGQEITPDMVPPTLNTYDRLVLSLKRHGVFKFPFVMIGKILFGSRKKSEEPV